MTCAIIAKSLVNTGFINEYEPPYSKIKKERDTLNSIQIANMVYLYGQLLPGYQPTTIKLIVNKLLRHKSCVGTHL